MRALAIIPAIWAAAFLLWFFTIGAELAEGQGVVPETSPFLTACTSAEQLAVIAGLNLEKCRRVAEVVEGRTAFVTVKVKISGQGWFLHSSSYQQSVWSQSAVVVTPVG